MANRTDEHDGNHVGPGHLYATGVRRGAGPVDHFVAHILPRGRDPDPLPLLAQNVGGDPVAQVMSLTDDLGVDVAIEAVGVPATSSRARTW